MSTAVSTPTAGTRFRVILWTAQILLAALFIMSGVAKLFTPIPELVKSIPWTGDMSVAFVRFIGIVDLIGGIGILLPALTRILPRLTVAAALGCALLQAFAMVFHLSRGEGMMLPFNLVLLGLSLLVAWGRSRRAPILPRSPS
jgi:uncharacterized membrane protein YphA (DoxX/SURF4 family)